MAPATKNADAEVEAAKKQLEDDQEKIAKAQEDLKKAGLDSETPPAKKRASEVVREAGYRSFVAPIERNTRFVVKRGTLVQVRDPNSPTGMKDHRRDGEKVVRFINGVITTDDPDIIAWCEAHPEICRDADQPLSDVWFQMRSAQVPTAHRDSTLPPAIDVDAALRGEMQDFGKDPEADTVRRAREFARQANERS